MTEQRELDFKAARERRDRGLERTLTHAEHVALGWNMAADEALAKYLEAVVGDGTFLAEQYVAWARRIVGDPPDGRAWGGPIRRAALAHRIVRIGYAPAASSNCSPKALWRAVPA